MATPSSWRFLLILGLFVCSTLITAVEPMISAPDPAVIHGLMVRVNDWQVAHPYQKPERDCDWIRGTWYTGVMAAYRASGIPC